MIPVPDAAWLLGVDEMTIHRLIAEKVIPAGRIINGKHKQTWRVPRALVEGFVAAIYAGAQVSLDDYAAAWSAEVVA
jgi:excisionase family DNA binding protein